MRFEDMPMAAVRENDSPSMVQAIERLLIAGAEARRPIGNPHQIKVTPDLSFYPTTGRMLFDGGPARRERGVDALIQLLERQPQIIR